jgi:hypothetical protein
VFSSNRELPLFRIFIPRRTINSPFFCTFPAMIYCRIAHARIYSGTSSAHRNNGSLYVKNLTNGFRIHLSKRLKPCFSGVDDILGCRETQVQRKIVDKQLQMIFKRDRVWTASPQTQESRLSIDGVGTALPKPLWKMAYTSSKTIMNVR